MYPYDIKIMEGNLRLYKISYREVILSLYVHTSVSDKILEFIEAYKDIKNKDCGFTLLISYNSYVPVRLRANKITI